jgi:hypothetical protein
LVSLSPYPPYPLSPPEFQFLSHPHISIFSTKQKLIEKTVTLGGAIAFLVFGVIYLAEALYAA